MLVNVIQRKEHEELIKEQEQKKEELLKNLSVQNEELNEYAHAVSHDLKAPLVNIYTLIDWFIDDNKESLDENFSNLLKEILFDVEKMDFLIKGILDYSTIDKLESEDRLVDFNLVVDEVLQIVSIPIEVGVTDKNKYFEFFVKDNGIGIHPDYFDQIFKVFTKLESTSSSSGIGLSIVKKIIKFYKGSIWIESEEGKGTTFYFTILKQ